MDGLELAPVETGTGRASRRRRIIGCWDGRDPRHRAAARSGLPVDFNGEVRPTDRSAPKRSCEIFRVDLRLRAA